MSEKFYPYLLRDESIRQFGASLSNIITLKRKEKSMSSPKKLIVFFDGEEQEPIEVTNVELKFDNDTIVLHINSDRKEKSSADKEPLQIIASKDVPSEDGIIAPHVEEKFLLKGADLEAFEAMSELRANRIEDAGSVTPTYHVIESSTFNIQDIQSVTQSTMELLKAEHELVADGFKALDIKTPEFIFETDQEHFKLIQTCTICKVEKVSTEESSKE